MKSKKSKILALIYLTLSGALAIFVFVNGLFSSPYKGVANVFIALGFTVAATVIWYLVHNLLHEGFHCLFALLAGAKILEFGAIGVLIYTKGRKRKIKFDLRSGYAGRVGFVCNNPKIVPKTLFVALVGGLFGTVLTFAIIILIYALNKSYFTYYLVLMGIFVVLYMFIVNYACDFPFTDGSMLFMTARGKKEFTRAVKMIIIEGMLYNGYTVFASIPRNDTYDMVTYYDVLFALEQGDIKSAKTLIAQLEEDEKAGDNEVIAAFMERFFIACIEKDKDYISNNKQRFDDVSGGDAQALRVQIAYRNFTGESDWADLLKKSFEKALNQTPLKGLSITQMLLMEKYVK